MSAHVRYTLATADAPGAIAIIQVHGEGAAGIVERLTGRKPDHHCRLMNLADIDEGLAAALSDSWCQIMPHGGMRVVELICQRLRELGAVAAPGSDAREFYPEAESALEADMLAMLARAASPAAMDRLPAQPRLWRAVVESNRIDAEAILRASDVLDRLVNPPTVVLVGRANVGKSTLSNLVTGRSSSITADLPGTTRDWVATLAQLPTSVGELAVRWFDTPGIRDSADPIEQRAIELARRVIESADVLIAVRDPANDWPAPPPEPPEPPEVVRRRPDLWVANKADTVGFDPAAFGQAPNGSRPLLTDALTGKGLDEMSQRIAGVLGLDQPDDGLPWAFCATLRRLMSDEDMDALAAYARRR